MGALELYDLFAPQSGPEEQAERRETRATIGASFPRRIQQCGRYDKNMAAVPHALVVPFPSFESNLVVLLESARALYDGRQSAAIDSMNQLYSRLSRVKGSRRHRELTMYLQQVLIAYETGDATIALDSLMSLFVRFISEPSAYQPPQENESELTA